MSKPENDSTVAREEAEGRQTVMRFGKRRKKLLFFFSFLFFYALVFAAWRVVVPLERFDTILTSVTVSQMQEAMSTSLVSGLNITSAVLKTLLRTFLDSSSYDVVSVTNATCRNKVERYLCCI